MGGMGLWWRDGVMAFAIYRQRVRDHPLQLRGITISASGHFDARTATDNRSRTGATSLVRTLEFRLDEAAEPRSIGIGGLFQQILVCLACQQSELLD